MSPSFAYPTLYLASSNPGKLRELRRAGLEAGVPVESLPEFRSLPVCVEDGQTFEQNSRKKALHYATLTRRLVLAEDSGLVVDALAGRPGVYSARFSGTGATDELNNGKLIEELSRVASARAQRPVGEPAEGDRLFPAHYACVIALAQDGNCLAVTEGRVDGMIIEAPKGSGGFGYDPHFFYPPFGKTFAEITASEKSAVSHRGVAFRKLIDYLASR